MKSWLRLYFSEISIHSNPIAKINPSIHPSPISLFISQPNYRKQTVIVDRRSDLHARCFRHILPGNLCNRWIRDEQGFLPMYSITRRGSFESMTRFHTSNQIHSLRSYLGFPAKMSPIMLLGNNSDRVTEREVSIKESFDLARKFGVRFC